MWGYIDLYLQGGAVIAICGKYADLKEQYDLFAEEWESEVTSKAFEFHGVTNDVERRSKNIRVAKEEVRAIELGSF